MTTIANQSVTYESYQGIQYWDRGSTLIGDPLLHKTVHVDFEPDRGLVIFSFTNKTRMSLTFQASAFAWFVFRVLRLVPAPVEGVIPQGLLMDTALIVAQTIAPLYKPQTDANLATAPRYLTKFILSVDKLGITVIDNLPYVGMLFPTDSERLQFEDDRHRFQLTIHLIDAFQIVKAGIPVIQEADELTIQWIAQALEQYEQQ